MHALASLLWDRDAGTSVCVVLYPDPDGLGRGPLSWHVVEEHEDSFNCMADAEGNPVCIVAEMRRDYLVLNLSSSTDPAPIEAWFHRTDQADLRLLWLGAALGRVLAPAEVRIPRVSSASFYEAGEEREAWLRRLRSTPPNHRPALLDEFRRARLKKSA